MQVLSMYTQRAWQRKILNPHAVAVIQYAVTRMLGLWQPLSLAQERESELKFEQRVCGPAVAGWARAICTSGARLATRAKCQLLACPKLRPRLSFSLKSMKTEQALASTRRRPNKMEAREMQTKRAEGRRPKKRKRNKKLGDFVACGLSL